MTRSITLLRKASELVSSYLKAGTYFVEICQMPIDPAEWVLRPEDEISIRRDYAAKLLERATKAQNDTEALIKTIEQESRGYFVNNIYRNPNWNTAYSVLKGFSENVLVPHIKVAQKRLDFLKEYKPPLPEIGVNRIEPANGDIHADIESAFEKLKYEFSKCGHSVGDSELNYFILLSIYAACYAIKESFDVDISSAAWNSLKAGLENHFTEKASMNPGESVGKISPDGSKVFAHYVPRCWEDMEKIENRFQYFQRNRTTSMLVCSVMDSPSLANLNVGTYSDVTYNTFLWLLKYPGKNIVQKMIGDVFEDAFYG